MVDPNPRPDLGHDVLVSDHLVRIINIQWPRAVPSVDWFWDIVDNAVTIDPSIFCPSASQVAVPGVTTAVDDYVESTSFNLVVTFGGLDPEDPFEIVTPPTISPDSLSYGAFSVGLDTGTDPNFEASGSGIGPGSAVFNIYGNTQNGSFECTGPALGEPGILAALQDVVPEGGETPIIGAITLNWANVKIRRVLDGQLFVPSQYSYTTGQGAGLGVGFNFIEE